MGCPVNKVGYFAGVTSVLVTLADSWIGKITTTRESMWPNSKHFVYSQTKVVGTNQRFMRNDWQRGLKLVCDRW